MKTLNTITSFVAICMLSVATLAADPAKGVFFKSPKEGATVGQKFKAEFGVNGMTITPAGQKVTDKTTGHFHVIIDDKALPEGTVIPSDAKHMHFGKGQTSADMSLTPGAHTLVLQFADGLHKAYGPEFAQEIHVTVK